MADPISLVGLVVTIVEVSRTLYEYVGAVKHAKNDVRRLSQELFALKGTLDQFLIIQKLEDEGSRADELGEMSKFIHETLNSIQKRLEKRKSKFGQAIQALAWPFNQSEVDKLVQALERAKTWFLMVMMQDSREQILVIYDEMQRLTGIIHEDIVERQLDRMVEETEKILGRLITVDYQEDHQKASRDRVPGTGKAFFGPGFDHWAGHDVKAPLLWITGKSGSGKTTLFSTMVDEMRARCSDSTSSSGVAFHYCSWDNAASQNPTNIFSSLLGQLAKLRPEVIEWIRPMSQRATSSSTNLLSISETVQFMTAALELVDHFYIFVDALNETEHQASIVSVLLSLCRSSSNLRVLATCTSDPSVHENEISIQRLSKTLVDNDIQVYVQYRLSTEPNLSRLSLKIKQQIQEKMATSADGAFRWAQMCMDRLSRLRTGRDVLVALRELPATLNETYARTLQRVSEADKSLTREALMWLAFSTHPMTLNQLSEAIVLQEDDRYLDDELRLTSPNIVVDICYGLVEVSSGDGRSKEDERFITLSHDSIRSFLTSAWIRGSPAAYFALDAVASRKSIMRKCLRYLSFDELSSGAVQQAEVLARRFKAFPLLAYAAKFWPDYLADPADPEDERLILDFFATKEQPNGGCFESWVQCLLDSTDMEAIKKTEPLYYAASYNMVPMLRFLLRPGARPNLERQGGRFGASPLSIACFRGNSEAAIMLLEAGANPNALDGGFRRSAYSMARHRNLTDVVALMDAKAVQQERKHDFTKMGSYRQHPWFMTSASQRTDAPDTGSD